MSMASSTRLVARVLRRTVTPVGTPFSSRRTFASRVSKSMAPRSARRAILSAATWSSTAMASATCGAVSGAHGSSAALARPSRSASAVS